jgi:OmpA-OmpF porin, OOP family
MRTNLLWAAILYLVPPTALAQDDCEGCKDHPQIHRFPGFYLSQATVNDFNAISFTVAEGKEVEKEGKYWKLWYTLKEGGKAPSCVETARNYENAFKKGGGKLVWRTSDWCTVTLTMPIAKSERWMKLENNVTGNGTIYTEIIDVASMEQKVEVSASEMLEALNKNGFVALHGILFDTGRDTIKPESEPLLAEVLKLLGDNASLKLSIEGHTDNQGNPKSNQTLSQKRAESVQKYLTAKGADAKRLFSKGWGDTKPVGDNRTEDGRAQNRRVELVKK